VEGLGLGIKDFMAYRGLRVKSFGFWFWIYNLQFQL
jgi:hypothetical protein